MKILTRNKLGYSVELTNEEMYKLIVEGLEYSGGDRAPVPSDLVKLDHVFARLEKEKNNRTKSTKVPKEIPEAQTNKTKT